MARRQISLEWQVVEDAAAWPDLSVDEAKTVTPHRSLFSAGEQWLLVQICRIVAILAGAVTITGASFSPTHHASAEDRGVQATLQLEAQAWQQNDGELFNALIDPQVSTRWQREWQKSWNDPFAKAQALGETVLATEQLDELVLVTVQVTRPDNEWWRSIPYRENRFYREQEQGWLRTLPQADFWGELRTLETPHLRFEFYDQDAKTVMALGEQMEHLYLRLYAMLALDPPRGERKLTLAVMPFQAREWGYYGERQEFTTPLLAEIPAQLTDADYLAHQFVSRLVYQATRSRVSTDIERDFSNEWRTMIWALNGWLRSELLAQRSPWHQQADALFRQHDFDRMALSLAAMSELDYAAQLDRAEWMLHYAMAESVLVYMFDAYGIEQVPALLQTMHDVPTWDQLTRRLFGLPVETFEAGWQRYLAATYAVTTGPTQAEE